MKKYQSFLCEIFQFLEVKFSIYLYRRVFVMARASISQCFNVTKPPNQGRPYHNVLEAKPLKQGHLYHNV